VRTRTLTMLTAGLLAATTVAGCSSSGKPTTSASQPAAAKTITVWLMDGDLTDTTVAAINASFTAATGAKVNVQIQEWDDINTKISTALAQDNPPDVIDIGNTDVPLFAASGGLMDITSAAAAMSAGQTWLQGLVGPATVDGKLYAAPLFAGNRAVVYNKKIWAAAGVTAAPTSYAELTGDLDKIKAKNTAADFSAFYLPGAYWFGGMQFVWDAGGQIATNANGKWTGALESPQAQDGLARWKSFQNTYSPAASRNTDNKTPDQAALLASGKTAAILDTGVNKVLKDNPALKDDIGVFPFPSITPGKTQPVFLGGSDLAVSTNTKNKDLALAYLKAATDPTVQKTSVVGVDGWTPVSTQIIDAAGSSVPATAQAFYAAAKNSVATPATPGWATIESDNSLKSFFGDIATGHASPADAAKAFDTHLDQALNAAP
jgi:N,N'-diacetylchitobiose transport system substrate-binding protein